MSERVLDRVKALAGLQKGLRAVAVLGALSALSGACKSDTLAPKGQLMVVVYSDMEVPKDFDGVRVEVLSFGSTQFANSYRVGTGGLQLPATLAVVAGEDAAKPVTIRVMGMTGTTARTLREVVTTVPPDRVATLRVPVEWLCDGTAQQVGVGQYTSTCPEGKSCLAGVCTENKVDSAGLPTYAPDQVFGGGSETGGGSCFDTVACMKAGSWASVDLTDCTVAAPGGSNVNVALAPTDGAGICGDGVCFVVLDGESQSGWHSENGRLSLPARVCELINQGKIEGVVVSTACTTKTASFPPCGAWSSVSGGKTIEPAPGTMTGLAGMGGAAGQGGTGGDAGMAGMAGQGGAGMGGAGMAGQGGMGGAGMAGMGGAMAGMGGAGMGGAGTGGAGMAGTGGAGMAGQGGAGMAGQGGAGQGGAGGAEPTLQVSNACQACFASKCTTLAVGCLNSPSCKACIDNALDPSCDTDPVFTQLVTCGCGNEVCDKGACVTECTVIQGGSVGGSGGGGGGGNGGSAGGVPVDIACMQCIGFACASQGNACLADPGCSACINNALGPGCDSDPLFAPLVTCGCGACGATTCQTACTAIGK